MKISKRKKCLIKICKEEKVIKMCFCCDVRNCCNVCNFNGCKCGKCRRWSNYGNSTYKRDLSQMWNK